MMSVAAIFAGARVAEGGVNEGVNVTEGVRDGEGNISVAGACVISRVAEGYCNAEFEVELALQAAIQNDSRIAKIFFIQPFSNELLVSSCFSVMLENCSLRRFKIKVDGNDQWNTSQFQYVFNSLLRVEQSHFSSMSCD